MINKKKILIVVLILFAVELFRAEYYSLLVKQSMVEVINYLEDHKRLDESLIFSLESDKNIILHYERIEEDTYDITLVKKHVILFFITRNVELKQKYIVARLTK